MVAYSNSFYLNQKDGSSKAAELVAPLAFKMFKPQSVVDVGCGLGGWLDAFKRSGVEKVYGFEGEWIKNTDPIIDRNTIEIVDLAKQLAHPYRYDLAISLEVAEHINEFHADVFIDNIVALSDLVIFSAAIPSQGGTEHVNEQWPSYWASKFFARGYASSDIIRPLIWSNPVPWWYRQNIIVYYNTSNNVLIQSIKDTERNTPPILNIVHPSNYARYQKLKDRIDRLEGVMPTSVVRWLREKFVASTGRTDLR